MGDLSKNFNRSEFKCKCGNCSFDTVDHELIKVLEGVRSYFKAPVTINSSCRCARHNDNVGGAKNSKHLYGIAADIVVKGVSPTMVVLYLTDTYPMKYGIGNYKTFTHIDVRQDKARWLG